jgi:hypothetical protein
MYSQQNKSSTLFLVHSFSCRIGMRVAFSCLTNGILGAKVEFLKEKASIESRHRDMILSSYDEGVYFDSFGSN